jgi:dipeptidase E
MTKKLFLLSNSTVPGTAYLEWAKSYIKDFFSTDVKRILFFPYAGVSVDWDAYEKKVQDVFLELGYDIYSIHKESEPLKAIHEAEAIAVGGGNTFKLVHDLQISGQMQAIREKAENGTPFIGWSAGSNVACPRLLTTNDMPIIQPPCFDCLNLIPFQINPHYLDHSPAGHGGETREMRLEEFMEINPDIYVVGLREATLLHVQGNNITMLGDRNARIFKKGTEPRELNAGDDFSFLLK